AMLMESPDPSVRKSKTCNSPSQNLSPVSHQKSLAPNSKYNLVKEDWKIQNSLSNTSQTQIVFHPILIDLFLSTINRSTLQAVLTHHTARCIPTSGYTSQYLVNQPPPRLEATSPFSIKDSDSSVPSGSSSICPWSNSASDNGQYQPFYSNYGSTYTSSLSTRNHYRDETQYPALQVPIAPNYRPLLSATGRGRKPKMMTPIAPVSSFPGIVRNVSDNFDNGNDVEMNEVKISERNSVNEISPIVKKKGRKNSNLKEILEDTALEINNSIEYPSAAAAEGMNVENFETNFKPSRKYRRKTAKEEKVGFIGPEKNKVITKKIKKKPVNLVFLNEDWFLESIKLMEVDELHIDKNGLFFYEPCEFLNTDKLINTDGPTSILEVHTNNIVPQFPPTFENFSAEELEILHKFVDYTDTTPSIFESRTTRVIQANHNQSTLQLSRQEVNNLDYRTYTYGGTEFRHSVQRIVPRKSYNPRLQPLMARCQNDKLAAFYDSQANESNYRIRSSVYEHRDPIFYRLNWPYSEYESKYGPTTFHESGSASSFRSPKYFATETL
ncbi:hypothetical protein HK096_007172, partial [Nowakowskiella sp. JEL0078]